MIHAISAAVAIAIVIAPPAPAQTQPPPEPTTPPDITLACKYNLGDGSLFPVQIWTSAQLIAWIDTGSPEMFSAEIKPLQISFTDGQLIGTIDRLTGGFSLKIPGESDTDGVCEPAMPKF